jgi:hypothetical protein
MSMKRLKLRRRKIIIDRAMQFSLLAISLSYVLFFVMVLALALFAPLVWRLNDPALPSSESAEAARGFLYLHHNFWPPVFLTFVVITLHSIRTSHKIAGPLFRFRKVFEAIKNGSIPAAKCLRKEDYLHGESFAMGEMLESLRARIKGIQEAQADLCRTISEYSSVAESDSDSMRRFMPDLIEKGDRLARKVREFTV